MSDIGPWLDDIERRVLAVDVRLASEASSRRSCDRASGGVIGVHPGFPEGKPGWTPITPRGSLAGFRPVAPELPEFHDRPEVGQPLRSLRGIERDVLAELPLALLEP